MASREGAGRCSIGGDRGCHDEEGGGSKKKYLAH